MKEKDEKKIVQEKNFIIWITNQENYNIFLVFFPHGKVWARIQS